MAQGNSASAPAPTPGRGSGGNREQRRRAMRRSRTVVGASLVAFSGLAAGYLQALRSPVAYAVGSTCEVTLSTDDSALKPLGSLSSCLYDASQNTGAFTIDIQTDITLSANTITVDRNGAGAAIDLVINGNGRTITGAAATNTNSRPFTLNNLQSGDTIEITDLTIDGAYQKGSSDDDGGALRASAASPSADLLLSGVKVVNSYSFDDGGAIYIGSDVDVRISGSLFARNESGSDASYGGGAVYAEVIDALDIAGSSFDSNSAVKGGGAVFAKEVGSISVTDSSFTSNTTDSQESGGAIAIYNGYGLVVERSTFQSNISDWQGGAIYSERTSSGHLQRISNSSFVENVAADSGGALGLKGNTNWFPQVSGTLFARNQAARGGAAYLKRIPISVKNSTFDGNHALDSGSGKGGAVYSRFSDATLDVEFSTFSGNATDDSASAIFATDAGTVTLVASVISDDTVGTPVPCNIPVADDTDVFATDPTGSCGLTGANSDDTFAAADFLFEPLADNGGVTDTLAVPAASPLVSRGAASDLGTGVTADQRGAARPYSGQYTIGAFQFGSTPAPGQPNAPVASAGNASASVVAPTSTVGGAPTSWVIGAYSADDTPVPTDDTCAVGSGSGSCTITGLTNGRPYVFKATPSNAQGVGRLSPASNVVTPAAPSPTPPPTYPPSAPRDVKAAAGDREASVSWVVPASQGSFPISTYQVTSSPAGGSCLTASLACTVDGLSNGTEYTFSVKALNGAGWSPAGVSNAVTPSADPAPVPAPPVQPVPEQLTPGGSLLLTNGVVDPNVTVNPNVGEDGLVIVGDDFAMDLDGLDPQGNPLDLGPNGVLRLQSERDVATSGRGFLPNSDVDLYVDPPVQASGAAVGAQTVGAAAAEAVYVGTVRTDARGEFSGTATLPEDIDPGEHVLQAVGLSKTSQTRAMNLGVLVEQSLVLNQGVRKPAGRHDRIVTDGSSTGIPAGVKLTPHIRYNTGEWKNGVATIVVQSDGTFKWTRLINKKKRLTAYVSYLDVESNRVVWQKVR